MDRIVERIAAFVGGSRRESFDQLALDAARFQYRSIEPYRRLCDARERSPFSVAHWSELPAVPTAAFKSLRLHAASPREVFRSSGTSRGTERRSVHYHPFPELYRLVVDASFPRYCLPERRPLPSLSLVPPRSAIADSSLGFMVEHVLERWSATPRAVALDLSGLDLERVVDWHRRLEDRPALVLATALAVLQLTEELEATGRSLALPPGSVLFETGGFKSRRREVERSELLARVEQRLALPPERVVREYGMTELTSQAYTEVLAGGDPDRFVLPPWVRFRILAPLTLEPVPDGEEGLLALCDLGNVGSAIQVLTEDRARGDDDGFHLLGRARDAELRGCSLTVDELVGPPP